MTFYFFNQDKHYQETQDESQADWLHFEQPTDADIELLQANYQIPKDFLTAGVDPYEIPRYELFESPNGEKIQLLVVLTPVQKNTRSLGTEYSTKPFAMIIMPHKVLTISEKTRSIQIFPELSFPTLWNIQTVSKRPSRIISISFSPLPLPLSEQQQKRLLPLSERITLLSTLPRVWKRTRSSP